MIKRIITYTIGAFLLTVFALWIHNYLLDIYSIAVNTTPIYTFFFISFLLVVLFIEFVYAINKDQVGFSYLGTIVFKLGAFAAIFHEQLFGNSLLFTQQKISFLFPLILFLTVEAIYCGRLMNKYVPKSSNKSE